MARTKEQVQGDLAVHVGDLVACLKQALEDFAKEYGSTRFLLSKRTVANIIHDHIVHRLREKYGTLLDAEGDLAVHSGGNLNQLIFKHGMLKMRLKKFRGGLKTSNVRTQAVLDFKWQQSSFKEIPDPTNLNLGYKLPNEAAITSAAIWITCPDGERVGWSWEISADKVALTPLAPLADVVPLDAAKGRVRPKPAAEPPKEKPSKAEGDDDAGKAHE